MENSDVLALLGQKLGPVCEAGGVDGLREKHIVHDCGKLVGGHI